MRVLTSPTHFEGLLAELPSASVLGTNGIFHCADTGQVFWSDGSNLQEQAPAAGTYMAQVGLDVSKYGATGDGTDQSLQVLAAIASLGALTHGQVIDLWFPEGTSANPKIYLLNLGTIGTTAIGPKLKVRGGNKPTCRIRPASPTDPCWIYQGGPSSDSDDWEMSGFTLEMVGHRAYDAPLVVVRQPRNGLMDINMDSVGAANFTGTFVQWDGGYQSEAKGSWRTDKFAVGLEVLDNQVQPNGSIPPVIDTSLIHPVITGCFGVLLRSATTGGNVFRFAGYKQVSTNFYPLSTASVEQLLASASAAGANTLTVASATGINVNDAIAIDYESGAGHAEANKVTAVVGNVLTLAQPLVYNHDPITRGGVKLTVDATGGTYTITVGTQTTAAIAATDAAATVQTALENLSNVDPGDVAVSGGSGNAGGTTPYTLTFAGQYATAVLPALSTTSSLTGGATTATFAAPTSSIPVIVGGWSAMVGDNWKSVKFDACHFEGPVAAIGFGSVIGASVEGCYCSAGDLVRIYGSTRNLHIGPQTMRGRVDKNNILVRPTYSVATSDNFWGVDGPFAVDSAADIQVPLYGEVHTSRDWTIGGNTDNGHLTRRYNHGSLNALARMLWGTVASGAAKWAIYAGGRGLFTDGVSGKYLSGAGKTTVVDGDFTTVPTDGTEAVHYDTDAGKTYKSVRANGTWHVMAGPV